MSFVENHKKEINILFDILKLNVKNKFELDINSIDEIKIESRKKPLVYFRKMMMVILGEIFLKDYNQDEIAEVVDLDRTSFIYHSKMHLSDYTRYVSYKKEYDEIKRDFVDRINTGLD